MENLEFSHCHLFSNLDFKYLEVLNGGRNNRVFLYASGESKFVVKSFISDQHENDKYKREVSFLEYCAELGAPRVPRVLGKCDEHRFLFISFESGDRLPVIDENCARQMLDFLGQLNSAPPKAGKLRRLLALESVETLTAFEKTITLRLERIARLGIDAVNPKSAMSKPLRLLDGYFTSALYLHDKKALEPLIEKTLRTVEGSRFLSPSDLGAHNMLDRNGLIVFIDFEYSGIDSGINLLGDLITQPDTEWAPGVRNWFASEYLLWFFGVTLENFESLERVFAFRWMSMILLRTSAQTQRNPGRVELSSLVEYCQRGAFSNFKGEIETW